MHPEPGTDKAQVDLRAYAGAFSRYKPTIRQASSPEEASRKAADFLSQVRGIFAGDIEGEFHAQVDYLWAAFPVQVKTLAKYQEMLEVLLRQTVDRYWYAGYPRYQTGRDAENDGSLYSFRRRSADFAVQFRYVQYYGHLLMRIPNSFRLRYRWLVNHPGAYTQGLTTTRCTKAMAGLINQVSEDVAKKVRRNRPFRVLVNSVLRTVEYQDSLARIGYVAPSHSAHLAGYAVDLEKLWYQEHDGQAHNIIQETLGALYEDQVINLIEEGTHWHLCLNPTHIPHYEALAVKWARRKR